ncbi:MAG: cobaltochelatase subunit CobT, partial [Alphaproteobacteria bacterium]|nr:cobaltochelatase subunit CobT [Alphaproteobacteria bacterium]
MSLTGDKETPLDAFKRVTGATMRAMGDIDELEVSFGPDRASLERGHAKLPMPGRDLPPAEAAFVRGEADSLALRERHHDPVVHARLSRGGPQARAVFDALEQARVEAWGSRYMAGAARNLSEAVDERCRRQGFARASSADDVPLAEAVGLYARETLSGRAASPVAAGVLDLWRDWFDQRAADAFADLAGQIHDQEAFATLAGRLMEDLELLDDAASGEEEGSEDDADDASEDGEGDGAEGESDGTLMSDASDMSDAEGEDTGESGDDDADAEIMPGMGDEEPGRSSPQ